MAALAAPAWLGVGVAGATETLPNPGTPRQRHNPGFAPGLELFLGFPKVIPFEPIQQIFAVRIVKEPCVDCYYFTAFAKKTSRIHTRGYTAGQLEALAWVGNKHGRALVKNVFYLVLMQLHTKKQ